MSKFPSPAYLMGSLLEDGVDIGLADRLALGYADALDSLSGSQIQQWLSTMLARLGSVHHSSTALTVLAYPSDHDTNRYEQLARENGWKENDNAHSSQQD